VVAVPSTEGVRIGAREMATKFADMVVAQ
jgi:hypothetical protein